MKTITEGRLTFDFDDTWTVLKYDDTSYHRNQFQSACGGTKAVDIVAFRPKSCAFLVEAKDYCRPASDYRDHPRTKIADLPQEVAEKVRDSLAGLAAARLRANDGVERQVAADFFRCGDMRVVLHLEQPSKHAKLYPRGAVDLADVEQKLKQLLHAVDPHPRVVDRTSTGNLPWTVT